MTLGESWEQQAPNWIRWAREPGHDSYWRFHRDALLASLPPPGRLTLDIGCGEGRVSRDLRALGHNVIGVDQAPSMIAAAVEADPEGRYLVADAAALPFEDGAADLVVSFMALMDAEDMFGVLRELSRVLMRGGVVTATVVHPLNSGTFPRDHGRHTLVLDDYREPRRYSDAIERDGLAMTFDSIHYPLEAFWRAFRDAGLAVQDLRELYDDGHAVWSRVPLFLRLEATKP